MARQEGELKIRGKIGDLSFYKTGEDGFLARRKGGVTGERIKTDPNFLRTRENLAEFGRAGRASKVFRTALREILKTVADSRSTARLTKIMSQIVKADPASVRGERKVIPANVSVLKGFEFNGNTPFNQTFAAPFVGAINRGAGTMTVNIPEFVTAALVNTPIGTSHFQLTLFGLGVDFTAESALLEKMVSPFIEVRSQAEPAMVLSVNVPAVGASPLFLLIGIQFFQHVNGVNYLLTNESFDALKIIEVDVPA